MTTFDDRQKGFEKKYAHDAEMQFKAAARRNKLLGQWLAPQIGEADADAYAKTVVIADLEEDGDDDVVRKVMADIEAKGAKISEADAESRFTMTASGPSQLTSSSLSA